MKNLVMIVVAAAVGFALSYWFVGGERSEIKQAAAPALSKPLHKQKESGSSLLVNSTGLAAESNLLSMETIVSRGTEFEQTAELYTVVGSADFNGLKSLLAQAAALSKIEDRRAGMGIVLSRMGEVAPIETLALIENQFPFQYDSLSAVVWRAWSMTDFEAALAYSQNNISGPEKAKVADSLYRSISLDESKAQRVESALGVKPSAAAKAQKLSILAQTSLSDALAELNLLTTTNEASLIARQLGRVAARYYGPSVLDYKDLIVDNSVRKNFLVSAYAEIASTSPVEFFQQFSASAYSQELANGMRVAFNQIVIADLARAQEIWARLSEPRYKSVLASSLVSEMGKQDIVQAIDWATANSESGPLTSVFQTAIYALAQIDPVATFDTLSLRAQSSNQQQVLASLLPQIAKTDPLSALSRLENITNKEARRSGQAQILQSWIELDSVAAVDYLVENSERIDQSYLYLSQPAVEALSKADSLRILEATHGRYSSMRSQLVSSVVGADIAQGLAELETEFGGKPFFESLRIGALELLTGKDLAGAEQYVANMPEGVAKSKALKTVVEVSARVDPSSAARLALEIGNDRLRKEAISNAVASWTQSSPKEAKQWVSRLDGAQQDVALEAYVSMVPESLDDLVDMARKISDPAAKERAYTAFLSQFAVTNHKQVERIMKDLDFMSPSSKQSVTRVVEDCVLAQEQLKADDCQYMGRINY